MGSVMHFNCIPMCGVCKQSFEPPDGQHYSLEVAEVGPPIAPPRRWWPFTGKAAAPTSKVIVRACVKCYGDANPWNRVRALLWGHRVGPEVSKILAGHTSRCGRCQTAWTFVPDHATEYIEGRSMFPLCEYCWQELGNPDDRLPYYRALYDLWERETTGHACWDDIARAVASGK